MTDETLNQHEFSITTRVSGDVTVVAVSGQADLHTAPELRARLADVIDGGSRDIVVDMSDTTFVDSMTLGVLLGTLRRLQALGGRIAISCPGEHVRRVFEITSLDSVLNVHATQDGAIRSLAHASSDDS